ncbi:amino acid adenylation domain-containing protein, partial [Roseobacter sp.]
MKETPPVTDISKMDAAQKRALLAAKLATPPKGPRHAPLSLAQQRLWFIDQMDPGRSVYTICVALRIEGDLDQTRLTTALDQIYARHDSLRTRFADRDGTPVQIIDPAAPLPLDHRDHRDDAAGVDPTLRVFAQQSFDLENGPLVRCLLVQTGPAQHILTLAAHHIIADYRSLQVIIEDCAALYCGLPLPALTHQYGDYALAQRGRVAQMDTQLAFWRTTLDGLPARTDLPTDTPRPAKQDFAGARLHFDIAPDVTRRIEAFARDHRATPFMVCLAAFHILHNRYSGNDDICIGTTVSNRDSAHWQGLVGYFVNTLAIRTTANHGDDFVQFLARLRDGFLAGMRHQDVPFEQVVDACVTQRSMAHSPLFQSMFNLHEKQDLAHSLPGLTLTPYPLGGHVARFDLALDLFHGDQISGVLEYATGLFSPDTAARMAQDYAHILEAVMAAPTQPLRSIPLENEADRAQTARINDTAAPIPTGGLAHLLSEMAQRQGEKTALISGDTVLSFTALDHAAGRLAAYLAPRVAAQQRVAICLPRGGDMVVAMLAVLRLGAVYIPLDPTHPAPRQRMILKDAAPALMLVNGAAPFETDCPTCDIAAARPDIDACAPIPPRAVAQDTLAYTIFTSGTTGRPKGVPIRHDSLVNLLTSMAQTPGLSDNDTLVAVTTSAFDIAALELFGPLLAGGTVVLACGHDVLDGRALSRLIAHHAATVLQATPATWRLLLEDGWQAPLGFKMLCGGEALDLALANHLLDGHGQLWNMYGPTETTIWSTCAQVTRADISAGRIPLGAPIANTTLHVLDAAGQRCPPGVSGALMIGGAGLSPGYLDRPDLTAQHFIDDPADPATRLYRTGDMVRRHPDGTLAYLGRMDFQVKLRGFRIELAEIETLVASEPAVEQAVVVVEGTGDTAQLVAYIRGAALGDDIDTRLRVRVADGLPSYMAPAHYITLDQFPLNANGKVDRKRLPRTQPSTTTPNARPQTGTQTLLAQLWAEVLGDAAVTPDTDFFAAGGHSLLAMRMIARLPFEGSRALPLRLLFEAPRLKDFAMALDHHALLTGTPPDPIPNLADTTPRPLSYAQDRQWTLCTLDPDSAAYNLPAAVRVNGDIDAQRLGHAYGLLTDRHEVLRCTYPQVNGRATVRVHPKGPTHVPVTDTDATALQNILRVQAARPFDLGTGPLIRLHLYRLAPQDHAVLLVLHHINADAVSVELLLRELMNIYQAIERDANHRPTPLPISYADYAAWQKTQDFSGSKQFWVDHLTGAPPLLDLPLDFPRKAHQTTTGGSVDFAVSGAPAQALRDLAAAQGSTAHMTLMGLYAVFLSRYSNSSDIVLGTPVSQRPHPDLDALAGMFVNTLALRLDVDPRHTTTQIIRDVRQRCLAGFQHQDMPFEHVVEALSPERSWSHAPIFQAMFTWKSRPDTAQGHDAIAWQPLTLAATTSKVDLTLAVLDQGDDFALRFEYNTGLFRPDTARHFALSFEALVHAALAAPDCPVSRLSMLHPDQSADIARWNDTGSATYDAPVGLHAKISARTHTHRDQPAVRHHTGDMTYGALDRRSDTLAAHLQSTGIGKGDRVGIALGRHPDMITAMVAVLKTGAAYVPLDPAYPADRIAYIRTDAGLALTLTHDATGDGLMPLVGFFDGTPDVKDTHGGQSQTPSPVTIGPDDIAYLIYTSGSTGTPKGVVLSHGNAHALIHWSTQTFTPQQMRGVLAATSVCFDLSVFEIFATLASGGTVMLVDDLFALHDAPFRDDVTLINTVPSPMAEFIKLGPLPAATQTVCLAGEPLPPALAKRIYATGTVTQLWNLYGPSEDTTYSTAALLPKSGETCTIGAPVFATRAYVLDDGLNPLPPALPGELFLAGAGVSQGYWNRPDDTAAQFLPNPFDTDGTAPIMYRTGDRVRRAPDGTLDYMGRGDRQVKIRGFRIEPGEVETALTDIDGVTAAAVDGWHTGDTPLRLTAWVEGTVAQHDIVAALGQVIPAHCVPTLFVISDALPRLPNGKLDRSALPAPTQTATTPVHHIAPGLEADLAAIWQRVLGRGGITRDDNFFRIGGDSILAIQVVAEARDIGMPLSPRDLFQHPSIGGLIAVATTRTPLPGTSDPMTGPQRLTPI